MSKISVSATLSEMMDGDLRLDATYYTSSVYQAKKIIEDYADNGNDVKLLGELSEPDPKVVEQYQHVVIHASLRRDGVNGDMDWYCPARA